MNIIVWSISTGHKSLQCKIKLHFERSFVALSLYFYLYFIAPKQNMFQHLRARCTAIVCGIFNTIISGAVNLKVYFKFRVGRVDYYRVLHVNARKVNMLCLGFTSSFG